MSQTGAPETRRVARAHRRLAQTRPWGALRRVPPVRTAAAGLRRLWGRLPCDVDTGGVDLRVERRLRQLYGRGHEPLTMEFLERALEPGMVAVNVGAHVGYVAIRMARRVGPGGKVYAVEPAPGTVRLLRRNLRVNGVGEVVEVIPCAAGPAGGRRDFSLTRASDLNSFYRHPMAPTRRKIEVEQVRIDDVVPAADLITLDVEGGEHEALDGMTRLLDSRPILVVEWNPDCQAAAGFEPAELAERLGELRYELTVLDEFAGRSRPVREITAAIRKNELIPRWYGNLVCRPNEDARRRSWRLM